jgi:hypothetical protein
VSNDELERRNRRNSHEARMPPDKLPAARNERYVVTCVVDVKVVPGPMISADSVTVKAVPAPAPIPKRITNRDATTEDQKNRAAMNATSMHDTATKAINPIEKNGPMVVLTVYLTGLARPLCAGRAVMHGC